MSEDKKWSWVWPSTWPGAVVAIVLLVFISFWAFVIAHDPRYLVLIQKWQKGGKDSLLLQHVFVFTTPSWKTKYDLTSDDPSAPPRQTQLEELGHQLGWYVVTDPKSPS